MNMQGFFVGVVLYGRVNKVYKEIHNEHIVQGMVFFRYLIVIHMQKAPHSKNLCGAFQCNRIKLFFNQPPFFQTKEKVQRVQQK